MKDKFSFVVTDEFVRTEIILMICHSIKSYQDWNRTGRFAGCRSGPVELLKPAGFHRFFYQFLGTEISLFCLFLSISAALKMQKYEFERLQLTNL
jgi:hypothetical protein